MDEKLLQRLNESMISAAQSRMARAGLNWSIESLEAATGLSKTTLRHFEMTGDIKPSTARRIQAAFERFGIFFFDGGVAMRSEAGSPRPATEQFPPPVAGRIVRQYLARRGISQAQLAEMLGLSRPRTNFVLNGRCAITPEIAVRLGRVFEPAAEDWIWMQAQIDLFKARQKLADGEARPDGPDTPSETMGGASSR